MTVAKFGGLQANNYIDGKKLFEVYWVDMGNSRSIAKLQKWCGSNNFSNPKTGKLPTRMGVWKCMWRWASRNMDEAYAVAQKGVAQQGEFITPEEWLETMKTKIETAWQYDNFKKKWDKANDSQ